ncbi:acyltransferase family protein [Deinococcus radiopugnans]|uniref:acyltransferase family protein n=1 Tax=Deinococcus radiopugnans TaxID=57497 RepID=UPI000691AFA0|nr:acyltransferase [Deinococcus radiopugnans]
MTPRRHLHALTSVRFFAALIVVFFHYGQAQFANTPQFLQAVVANGYVGVQLFFVLSGFILTYTYLPRAGWTSGQFWRARFARIYPVYFVAMLLALPIFLGVVARDGDGMGFAALTTALTTFLLQAWVPQSACALNCPGWSLSAEAFFYALFPLLLLLIRGATFRKLVIVGVVAAVLNLVPPMIAFLIQPDTLAASTDTTASSNILLLEFLRYTPLFHLGEFVLGMSLGGLYVSGHRLRHGGLVALAALIVVVALLNIPSIPYLLLHNGLLAIPFGILIYGLAQAQGAVERVASNRTLLLLGEASYALYILHAPIFTYAKLGLARVGISNESWLFLIVYLAVLITASIAAFKWLENPARKYFTARFKPRISSAA